MAEKPNDRLNKTDAPGGNEPEPKIYLLVNGQQFVRPGMETYFASADQNKGTDCSCNPVGGVYCSCNKVCTCNPLCSCQGHSTCSNNKSSGGGKYCSCVPVH
ncbi:MAG: hypothetical protein ABFD04_10315 [Syntrophomonas sp.]